MNNIVFPDYNNSLLNLVNSILRNYNVKISYPSLPILDTILKKSFKNVVFFLVDAMGSEILNKHKDEVKFLIDHKIKDITTVFPSTTVAATTTAVSGMAPLATGWLGWMQYVEEEDRNIVFFLNQDYYDENYIFNYNVADKYFRFETIYEKIEKHSPTIKTYEIFPEFRIKEHNTVKKEIDTVLNIIKSSENNFIYAYWDKLDTIMHEFGTESIEVKNHLKAIDESFRYLNENIDKDTLVIITADHGQVDIEGIKLWEYPELTSKFKHQPAIEARATAFYINENEKEAFEISFNNLFRDKFVLYKSEDVIKLGLFGKGLENPRTKGFLGDYFAVAIDKYSFRLQNAPHIHKATHAGLLKDEMMIPLIILK